eukprot:scaffold91053_cov59-Phaeocystis_antarctica.AAC.1
MAHRQMRAVWGIGVGWAGVGRTVDVDLSILLVVVAPLQRRHGRRLEQQVACHLGKLEAVVAHPHHHAAPLLRVKAHEAKVKAKDALDGYEWGGGGEDEPG